MPSSISVPGRCVLRLLKTVKYHGHIRENCRLQHSCPLGQPIQEKDMEQGGRTGSLVRRDGHFYVRGLLPMLAPMLRHEAKVVP